MSFKEFYYTDSRTSFLIHSIIVTAVLGLIYGLLVQLEVFDWVSPWKFLIIGFIPNVVYAYVREELLTQGTKYSFDYKNVIIGIIIPMLVFMSMFLLK